jgi:hypothetical protein
MVLSMRRSASLVALFALLIGGCGESMATVKGKVVEDGKPMRFESNQAAIQLTLVDQDGKLDNKHSYTAVVNDDGSFEVVASGGELVLGNYQVAVLLRGGDPKYKVLAPPDSPLRRELKSGKNEIIVDLAKPPEEVSQK